MLFLIYIMTELALDVFLPNKLILLTTVFSMDLIVFLFSILCTDNIKMGAKKIQTEY